MTRRELPGTLLAGAAAAQSRRSRPNVVFIMTDDHGAWALNCAGCKELHTPNLDALAAGGVRFSRAYAATPVCSASRATYLTGRLPNHHGVQDYLQPRDSFGPKSREFLRGQPMISEVLARNGYTAGISGKWHLGRDGMTQAGFSDWSVVPGGASPFRDVTFIRNGKSVPTTGFKEDRLTDFGIEFIEKNKEQPFFLFLSFFAPHKPYNYQPEADRKWYENSKFECFPEEPMHPWHVQKLNDQAFPTINDFSNPASKLGYSALVTAMDRNVGRVVKRLEELGLTENTVIAFTADQGHNCGHHGIWGKGNSTVPFNLYDTSIQVPLIWSHPGSISGGRVVSPMVSSYDFFPTLLDYVGVAAPPDPHRAGRSYAGFLRGKRPDWTNEVCFEYQYVRGIRTENLKYVERTKDYPSELFDVENDPGEKKNVLNDPAYKRQAAALRSRLHSRFEKLGTKPLESWRETTTQDVASYTR